MRTLLSGVCLLAILASMPASAQRVSQIAPKPNRTIVAPGSQRPPGGDHPESTAGTIEGFVYWDANHFSHVPAGSCSGLAVTVAVGSSSGGPLVAYTPLATLTNNFKYAGQVKEFLTGGKVDVYDVCTYGYNQVPVGPDLQVKLTVTQPGVFSPVAVPQFAILGPIKIINAQCNMLPRITNPNVSDLFAHWGSCQNMAYDVNFAMHTAPRAQFGDSGGGGISSASRDVRVERNPGPAGSPLLKNPGLSGTPMLSGTPPQGMPASGAGSTGQSSSTNGGLLGSRGQAPSVITDGTRQTYTGTTRSVAPSTLTNADVASMLRAGLAESVIISSIRSAKKNFDFSPAGCQTLQRAWVSVRILAAMGDGSVRPCPAITGNAPAARPGSTVELNPQPLPPGSKAAPGNRTALKPISLAPPKALRKITNPRLAEQNASIIAVLEQQRLATQQEAAAIKLGMRTSASAVPSRVPVAARSVQGRAAVQNLGPEKTQSEKGNLASSIVQAPVLNSIVLMCSQDPTPRIVRLSGGEGHGILTPEAKYNLYTITGCGFGPFDPGNSAYIFGVNGFKENLNIDFWSDNGITVHLDPWLAGVLDQDNVTLVVAPTGKQPFNKSGYKFYAARGMPAPDGSDQEVQLPYNSMPQAKIALVNVTNFPAGFDQLPANATSAFPSFSFQGTPVAGWVFRYLYGHADRIATFRGADCYINDIGFNGKACQQPDLQQQAKTDVWDFNGLVPGFSISSYMLYYDDVDPASLCQVWTDMSKEDTSTIGNWDFNLNQFNHIDVKWSAYSCFGVEFGTRDNFADQSAYGLAVWVLGPRCVDAWSGHKDQACMSKVKQILG